MRWIRRGGGGAPDDTSVTSPGHGPIHTRTLYSRHNKGSMYPKKWLCFHFLHLSPAITSVKWLYLMGADYQTDIEKSRTLTSQGRAHQKSPSQCPFTNQSVCSGGVPPYIPALWHQKPPLSVRLL